MGIEKSDSRLQGQSGTGVGDMRAQGQSGKSDVTNGYRDNQVKESGDSWVKILCTTSATLFGYSDIGYNAMYKEKGSL